MYVRHGTRVKGDTILVIIIYYVRTLRESQFWMANLSSFNIFFRWSVPEPYGTGTVLYQNDTFKALYGTVQFFEN